MLRETFAKIFSPLGFRRTPSSEWRSAQETASGRSVGGALDTDAGFSFDQIRAYYIRNPIFYAAVNTIVNALSSVPLRIRDRQSKLVLEDPTRSRLGYLLLQRPNVDESAVEFRHSTFQNLELFFNAFWEIVLDKDKKPIALYLLDPSRVQIQAGSKRKVAGYVFQRQDGREVRFRPEEVLHLKYPSPGNEYWGVPPVASLRNYLDLHYEATRYSRAFFQNDATPGGVITTDNLISDEHYRRLKRRWEEEHRGSRRAFKIAILDGGLKFEPVSAKISEVQYPELYNLIRDTILATYGVPPSMIGFPGISNYATARVAQAIFYDVHLLPRLRVIENILDELFRRFEPEFEPFFDINAAPGVNVTRMSANSRVVSRAFSLKLITRNEARSLLGLPPLPPEEGDVFYGGKPRKEVLSPASPEQAEEDETAPLEGGNTQGRQDSGDQESGAQQEEGENED